MPNSKSSRVIILYIVACMKIKTIIGDFKQPIIRYSILPADVIA